MEESITNFIKESKTKFGDKFDYSLIQSINSKIQLICKKHGLCITSKYSHLKSKYGCKGCVADSQRKTSESFIKEAIDVHGNRYDYSQVDYKKNDITVEIICKKHGSFMQSPANHLNGQHCMECYQESKKMSESEFFERVNELYGNKYDYSNTVCEGYCEKITYVCLVHGSITQTAKSHINSGCPKCGYEISSIKRTNYQDDVIKRFKLVHGDKYDYSSVDYVSSMEYVKIICKYHGTFKQRPNAHLSGRGCHMCRNLDERRKSFFDKCNTVHNNDYEYKVIDYFNNNDNIEIKCKHHGWFSQRASDHTSGTGCPACSESKGERQIRHFLKNNNIDYVYQKKYDELGTMAYDFHVPDFNLLIEYDGEHHFEPVEYFGGQKVFEGVVRRDQLKNEYAIKNNIKLIRIPYTEFNSIEIILNKSLYK